MKRTFQKVQEEEEEDEDDDYRTPYSPRETDVTAPQLVCSNLFQISVQDSLIIEFWSGGSKLLCDDMGYKIEI